MDSYYWRKTRKLVVVLLALAMVLGMVGTAAASVGTEVNLAVGVKESDWILGAYWAQFPGDNSSGTGNFNTYLSMQALGTQTYERGYNSDRSKTEFDEKKSWTKALELEKVPLVRINDEGPWYREFVVDVNQLTGGNLLSLDYFQVWQTNDAKLDKYDEATHSFPTGATLVYDIDGNFPNQPGGSAPSNHYLILDYLVNSGSGWHDYRVLVPDAWFNQSMKYVTMFAHHGDEDTYDAKNPPPYPCNDGFEEWGVRGIDVATKSGLKWHDLDADGSIDAGEPGLAGWIIYVDYNDSRTLDPGEPYSVTGSNGTYMIGNIMPGTFWVREQAPDGQLRIPAKPSTRSG